MQACVRAIVLTVLGGLWFVFTKFVWMRQFGGTSFVDYYADLVARKDFKPASAAALLFAADGEPELDHVDAAAHQVALELGRLVQPQTPPAPVPHPDA